MTAVCMAKLLMDRATDISDEAQQTIDRMRVIGKAVLIMLGIGFVFGLGCASRACCCSKKDAVADEAKGLARSDAHSYQAASRHKPVKLRDRPREKSASGERGRDRDRERDRDLRHLPARRGS